jgi:hypothetical protein
MNIEQGISNKEVEEKYGYFYLEDALEEEHRILLYHGCILFVGK